MGNKFREHIEAKHISINIYFPDKGYAEAFKSIIKNVENNLIFTTRMKIHKFKVELNKSADLDIDEINDKWVLSIQTFLSKLDNPIFLECNGFQIKTPIIATKEFYCEVKDRESDKLTYKIYKSDKVSKVKLT